MSSRYIIGIDLGTTNCALAYVDSEAGDEAEVCVFEIPQLLHAGSVEARAILPSFLYLPEGSELAKGALALPWDEEAQTAVGAFARDQGNRVPGRLVGSAKSWLSHADADRRGPILPWQADEAVERVSPVEASSRYLAHLRAAWDDAHPEHPLAEQEVLLTVPASFDAVARDLTMEAARLAGLESPRLLEEPQAAFHAWIHAVGDGWREQVSVGETVLVCDVGGGTTDLSLIAVGEEEGSLALERLAVGRHLLVGGDNMDLTLARVLEAELASAGTTIDSWQLQGLWHGCRAAKETLLGEDPPAALKLTIPGRGSKLIGGSIEVELTRERLDEVLLAGFLPACQADERPARRMAGLVEIGLPYEADPGITRHIAAFLADHGGETQPAAILFNGGVFSAAAFRARLLEVAGGWRGEAPRELAGAELDLAVARGAAAYGLARRGRGVRIRGGTARSYYIGVESAMPAVPGLPTPLKGICVAPRGMEEGSELTLPDRRFGLLTGEPARFRFFTSSVRKDDPIGAMIERLGDDCRELDPVEVTLEGEPGAASVQVGLESHLTELGTLELWAVEVEGDRRWKLSYEVRQREKQDA